MLEQDENEMRRNADQDGAFRLTKDGGMRSSDWCGWFSDHRSGICLSFSNVYFVTFGYAMKYMRIPTSNCWNNEMRNETNSGGKSFGSMFQTNSLSSYKLLQTHCSFPNFGQWLYPCQFGFTSLQQLQSQHIIWNSE